MKSLYIILLVVFIFFIGKLIDSILNPPKGKFISYDSNMLEFKKKEVLEGIFFSAYQLGMHYMYNPVDELRFYWVQIGEELEYASPTTKKYLTNLYSKKDLKTSFLELVKTSEYKEDLYGIYSFRVGWCYLKGVGVEVNLRNAEKYFEQSFNLGNTPAALVLLEISTSKDVKNIYYDRIKIQVSDLNNKLIDDLAKRFIDLDF